MGVCKVACIANIWATFWASKDLDPNGYNRAQPHCTATADTAGTCMSLGHAITVVAALPVTFAMGRDSLRW